MRCAACGAESIEGARYCRECGGELGEAAAGDGVPYTPPAPLSAPPLSPTPPPVTAPHTRPTYAYPPLPSGNDPALLPDAKALGWNWGGFFLPYWWLMGHGQLGAGLLLQVSMSVPFLNLAHAFVYPLTGIYLGLNGYETAWKNSPYHSVAQLRERERPWALWGVVGVVLFVCAVLLMFAFWASLTGMVEQALGGL